MRNYLTMNHFLELCVQTFRERDLWKVMHTLCGLSQDTLSISDCMVSSGRTLESHELERILKEADVP